MCILNHSALGHFELVDDSDSQFKNKPALEKLKIYIYRAVLRQLKPEGVVNNCDHVRIIYHFSTLLTHDAMAIPR